MLSEESIKKGGVVQSLDPDRVNRDWRYAEDIERAVPGARDLLRACVNEDLAMSIKLTLLRTAAEPILDAPGGDPMLLYRVANSLAKEQQYIETKRKLSSDDRLRARLTITEARIRGLHCSGRSDFALPHCLAGWTAIENFVGDRDALHSALSHRQPTIAGEFATQIAGRFAAVLKRARRDPNDPVRAYWTAELRTFVDSYMPDLDPANAFIYSGTPSLVQLLFLFAEGGDPRDRERILALRELDRRARETDARGQATIPMREAAVARYEGDAGAFEAHSATAWKRLSGAHLERHIGMATAHEYLEPQHEEDVA